MTNRPAAIIEAAGFVDFDSRSPILETDTGERWRLDTNGFRILMGDTITVSAIKVGPDTLRVLNFASEHEVS